MGHVGTNLIDVFYWIWQENPVITFLWLVVLLVSELSPKLVTYYVFKHSPCSNLYYWLHERPFSIWEIRKSMTWKNKLQEAEWLSSTNIQNIVSCTKMITYGHDYEGYYFEARGIKRMNVVGQDKWVISWKEIINTSCCKMCLSVLKSFLECTLWYPRKVFSYLPYY